MNSDELRALFLSFFEEEGHQVIPSSSLIPQGDPTLLLTTAGMVQIKPYFLKEAVPPSFRLASCQKCFRTTDIESVGDASHLTFFEMLGNFSVGDYFKKEAISWAWEFVTRRLKLPAERLWITIFTDDDEAFRLWREQGVPEQKILRFGEKDNFWGPAGNSGPCGPCSEIHYDFGEQIGCGRATCAPNCDCGRFSEIWNLVFAQYNQDEQGNRTPLPSPNIDTGMGLERTAAVIQGKISLYETDLFTPLLERVAELSGVKYGSGEETDNAMRVVVEHARGITFLIADGVIPSNEGRGYVLRRVLRRAALFGRRVGMEKPFLKEMAEVTIKLMGHIYPEIVQRQDFIAKVVELEEERFGETLSTGLNFVDTRLQELARALAPTSEFVLVTQRIGKTFEQIQKAMPSADILQAFQQIGKTFEQIQKAMPSTDILQAFQRIGKTFEQIQKAMPSADILQAFQEYYRLLKIPGKEAFKLYDTYGFPVELTKEIVTKSGFSVDLEGFEKEMAKQRERARAAHKFEVAESLGLADLGVKVTPFVGYEDLKQKTVVINLLVDSKSVSEVKEGQEAGLVLETTPFYGEMGGQVGDSGQIRGKSGRFSVTNTIRVPPDIIVHQGKVVEGSFNTGDEVEAVVDVERRLDIARNHTATHLLQLALRKVFGEHVEQRGSLVAPDRFRFDFSHLEALMAEEIEQVQSLVNEKIRQNLPAYAEKLPYKKAIKEGAIALFDEKYGDEVRVLKIGRPPISMELCGGTHVAATGEIGFFQIISEASIGAGLRRIEAITGRGAEALISRRLSDLQKTAKYLDAELDDVLDKAYSLSIELKNKEQQTLALERELAKKEVESLLTKAEVVNGVRVLAARVSSSRMQILREMSDQLREKLKSAVVVLGTIYEDKPAFIAAVTPDLIAKGYHAGEIVKEVAKVAGGGGGGKASLAQAGGKYKDKLDEALKKVKNLIKSGGLKDA